MTDDDVHPLTLLMDQRAWSKSDLADRIMRAGADIGLTLATDRALVWRWEKGGTTPSRLTQVALADLLHIDREVVAKNPWPAWLADVVAEAAP